ncbi:MAG: xanthine dehydrogenase family protein molybdopterin-binding subunit [Alphaproteobacteria bacterium]|nr:xanthine dehydrogenase family protein molybdopterin-binding subunit [Alphaproteobacteria bacterium]
MGAAVRRTEDRRLLTGRGRYASDLFPPNLCYAALVRSPHAHARIRSMDVSRAARLPGILAVLTGHEAAADGLKPMPHNPDWTGPPDVELRLPSGFEIYVTPNVPLPTEIVRYVGEAVALVVAESEALAAEAAELVDIEWVPLPSVVAVREAMREEAPRLWPDCSRNLPLTCEVGDRAACDRAFAEAAHVVRLDSWIHRVTGCPMEPRAVVGDYDAVSNRYTLYAASGRGAVQSRERLAATLGVPLESCRAVFGDMGGNFGTRNAFSPEFALMPWAARRVGRPVKWIATRSECFLSDYQARDLTSVAELALDKDGNFLGLRGENIMNVGAYTVYFWPLRKGLSMMQGVYRIPAVHFRGHAVLTNTAPVAVYRSAGRPEAIYMIERLIDLAAAQHGFDRVDLRRRNLIPAETMPFTNAVGVTYDSGDYCACMEETLDKADWAGFARRKAGSTSRGLCRGIAVANYIEVASGPPRERAELTVCDDRTVELVVGTMSSGQGHETSFAQLVAEWLQVPFARVRFTANDTDRVSVGGGSVSGRSMRMVSTAVGKAVEQLLARATSVAAHILQAEARDVAYKDGVFAVPGGASIGLWELANAVAVPGALPSELSGPLTGAGDITDRAGGYPYGCHVCEVEVDPDTGQVDIVSWTGVDDVGRAINPMILHGQAHGAIAQGLGQALLEAVQYEADTAQLLTGSFMDYPLPRADTVPSLQTFITEVPASSHPHGIRPGGEGGTTPALGLVVNAIVDALSQYGVAHIEMPATPQRVWRAIRDGRLSLK